MLSALVLCMLAQAVAPHPPSAQAPSTSPPYAVPDTYSPADPALSVFGQQKVTQEYPVLSLSFQYAISDDKVSTTTANGGTVTRSAPHATLATSTNTAGSAILQSNKAIRYTPGQGVRMRFTAVFSACTANSRQEMGLGDTVDGFFFGCVGASFGIIHRNNSAETFYPVTAWNGSQAPFDITKGNVYSIAYQWLGYGVIRFSMERPNGASVLVHQIDYPNSSVSESLTNPMMRVWVRVLNSGNASSISLKTPSIGVVSEGPPLDHGIPNGYAARKAISTSITNVVTLQNKSTYSSATNRIRVRLTQIFLSATGNSDVTCTLRKNATLAGSPSYTDNDTTRSVVSYDVAGTTVSNGRIVYGVVYEGGSPVRTGTDLNLFIEPGDTLTVACATSTGSPTVGVGLNWTEEFSG